MSTNGVQDFQKIASLLLKSGCKESEEVILPKVKAAAEKCGAPSLMSQLDSQKTITRQNLLDAVEKYRGEVVGQASQIRKANCVKNLLERNGLNQPFKFSELKLALKLLEIPEQPPLDNSGAPQLNAKANISLPQYEDTLKKTSNSDLIPLGEVEPGIFPELEALKDAFSSMDIPLREFVNQIRQLYALALRDSPESNPVEKTGSHVFYGGHVVVADGGKLYNEWSALINQKKVPGKERWSSHYPNVDVQQYEIRIPNLGGVLFGKTKDGHTWFQNEKHPASSTGIRGLHDTVAHLQDYFLYRATGKNIGALGRSKYLERTPLVIQSDALKQISNVSDPLALSPQAPSELAHQAWQTAPTPNT